MLYKLM